MEVDLVGIFDRGCGPTRSIHLHRRSMTIEVVDQIHVDGSPNRDC